MFTQGNALKNIFTIGYGGRSKDEFLALLRSHGIRTVADVRLYPGHAYRGTWVKAKTPDKGIEKWLADDGLTYKDLPELGNEFLGSEDWQERYRQQLESSGEQRIKGLAGLPEPICLLCAEKLSKDCHRRLIAEYLAEQWSIEIHHIE